jgi:hypothetical protein
MERRRRNPPLAGLGPAGRRRCGRRPLSGGVERHCVLEKITRKTEGEEAVDEGALLFLVGTASVQDP